MTAPGLPNHGDTVDLVLDGFGNDGVASNLPSSSLNFGFCRQLGSRLGSLTRDIFDAQGLPYPRASVVATALEMTINLLRTDRYLAILPESVSTFRPD